MQNAPNNKMFPPSYENQWPRATKAFEQEVKAAEAYADAPTAPNMDALTAARRRYIGACQHDERERVQAKVHAANAEIEREKVDFAIRNKSRAEKMG